MTARSEVLRVALRVPWDMPVWPVWQLTGWVVDPHYLLRLQTFRQRAAGVSLVWRKGTRACCGRGGGWRRGGWVWVRPPVPRIDAHAKGRHDLTDAQWELLSPLLPELPTTGRPRTYGLRGLVDAVRYRTRTGCRWRDIPDRYGPWWRAYALFRSWQVTGVWEHLERELASAVVTAQGTRSGVGRGVGGLHRLPGPRARRTLPSKHPHRQHRPLAQTTYITGASSVRKVMLRLHEGNLAYIMTISASNHIQ